MAKLKNCTNNILHYFLMILLLIGLYLVVDYMVSNPVQEGVVFTPYDNRMLFTKPWDQFCVNQPPSCSNNPLIRSIAGGGDQEIGCWCDRMESILTPDEGC